MNTDDEHTEFVYSENHFLNLTFVLVNVLSSAFTTSIIAILQLCLCSEQHEPT